MTQRISLLDHYQLKENGDSAVSIIFSAKVSDDLTRQILALKKLLLHSNFDQHFDFHLVDSIPAYQSLTLIFDRPYTLLEDLKNAVNGLINQLAQKKQISIKASKLIRIPVCYQKPYAPDLNELSLNLNLTTEELIKRHSQTTYSVHMLGFLPGFLYLGGLDERLHFPRKATPVTQLAKGSIGIGGNQTGIYPVESPGGWHIIGRTPINLFDITKPSPAIASPLDKVQFYSISVEEYETLKKSQPEPKISRKPSKSDFLLVKAGMQTSLQDSGRKGLMHLGVSYSGAMDKTASRLANYLVGKEPNEAVLEITMFGPLITFKSAINIAICGAQFEIFVNEHLVSNNKTIRIKAGDTLRFGQLISGARAYLAFSSKLNIKTQLNSYSTHLTARIGGLNGSQLKDGTIIPLSSEVKFPTKQLPPSFSQSYSGNYLLRCVKSVESEQFSKRQVTQFSKTKFSVSPQSNRMGIRLMGKAIDSTNDIQITSSGLTQGSIQITPSGQAVISSVDGQTIGGYPRIANIISADLDVLGQLMPNDSVSFCFISQSKANQLHQQKQKWLEKQLNC